MTTVTTLKTTSAILFYLLGSLAIVGIVLVNRNIAAESMTTMLNVIDLPLILSGMLYGGGSLILSLSKDRVSIPLVSVVFGILGVLFLVFIYLNFAYPFQVTF